MNKLALHLISEPFRGGYVTMCGYEIIDPDRELVGSADDPKVCRRCLRCLRGLHKHGPLELLQDKIRGRLKKLTELRQTGDSGEALLDEIVPMVLDFKRPVSYHSTVAYYHPDHTVSFRF